MLAMITPQYQRIPFTLLLLSLLFITSCGEDDSSTPTVLSITANVSEADEGEQFAITVRTDTPNGTSTDISAPLIYEGIDLDLIIGSDVTPVILHDQEFNSLLLIVVDDTTSTGDRELTVSIDESQMPSWLTLGNPSVSITIKE